MINGAQRLDSARSLGSDAGLRRPPCGFDQSAQEIRRDAGHVAGDHKIPLRLGMEQRGVDSAHGPAFLHRVRDDRQPERRVFLRVSHQRHIANGLPDGLRDVFGQRPRTGRQERFIAPHAAAAASHKHESGDVGVPGAVSALHEKMLTIAPGDRSLLTNKKVYICFILAFMILAASPIRAESASVSAPARRTFVVRVDRNTGKLVRRQLPQTPSPKAPVKTAPPAIVRLVDESSRAHGVDPRLVHSVIQVESNYDPGAVSPKGAEGLMQLTPPTARMLGVNNTFDPGENIEAGVKYLRYLQDLYRDDRLALAAYNAGPGAVEKYKTIPPYPETRKYVEKVGQKYEAAKAATPGDSAVAKTPGKTAPPAKIDPVAEQEKYSRVEQFIDKDGRLHLQSVP